MLGEVVLALALLVLDFRLLGFIDRLFKTPSNHFRNFMWASVCVAALAAGRAWGMSPEHYLAGAGLWALCTLAVFPLVFGFHVALFYTSRPIFEALMNACVERLDIVKDGSLYLRRWYLTPRFHWPSWLLDRLPAKPAFALQSRYFLHWILRSDDDRDPHDHPWSFCSRILDGEYLERVWFPQDQSEIPHEVQVDDRYFPIIGKRYWGRQATPGTVLWNHWSHTHMVQIVEPAWTLVFAGPHERPGDDYWGFWKIHPTDPSQDVWTHKAEYLATGDEIRT